ncbi:MAG: steroid 5-alpha reductase family enzyme [Chlamydiales bacterium]|jgi:steroid 5-alpha reductase family enzyme
MIEAGCIRGPGFRELNPVTSTLILPLTALGALSGALALAWRRQRLTRNAGIVDLIWAGSLGLMALSYAALADGWGPRRALVAGLAGLWSVRLSWHLALRVSREAEDGRYAILRERWAGKFDSWMFWFFQAQGLLAVLLSLVFLVLCESSQAGWRTQDVLASLLWIVSIGGEGVADRQLSAWRANPANRGRTCRTGLWGFSRHPNYFFEWLHWLVYPVLGLGLAWGWSLWLTPALMLFLVLKVTGIPPTEEQSLRSRGADYRAYQRTTNAFFPGPVKAASQELPRIS